MIRGLAEAAVFTGLAVALHLGGLALGFGQGGPTAGGAGGQAVVSLQGGSPATEALLTRWTDPPEVGGRAGPPPQAPVPDGLAPPTPDTDAPEDRAPHASLRLESSLDRPGTLPQVGPPSETPALGQPAIVPTKARPEPDPNQTARKRPAPPALRAAGTGGGAAAGLSGAAQQAAAQAGRDRLLALWGGRIRTDVERRKHYPRAAAGAGGTAVLRIAILGDGRLRAVRLDQSAGHPALDRAALEAVQGARFPPAPEGLGQGPHDFTFQMTFAP